MGAAGASDGARDGQGYLINGGSAGMMVQLEDLARTADGLGSTVASLRNLESRVTDLWMEVGALGGGSVTADRVRRRMLEAAHGFRVSAAALERLSDGVRKSAREYADTEGRVQLRMPWTGPISPWPEPSPGGGVVPTRGRMEKALASPADELALHAALLLLKTAGVAELRRVTVTPVPGVPGEIRLDGSASGLLARSRALKEEDNAGVVEVLRIDEDGRQAFVVTIPGTQGNGFSEGGANPFDVTGNGEARDLDSRYVAAAVAEALRQANAQAGDSVVLSGYSQGGDHAANVAVFLATESEYQVDFLLTAGSPTGATDLPPGLPALHLEHELDWVPGIDSLPNPDTPDRVTMTLTGPVATPDGQPAGLGPAHRLDNYLEGAALADTSQDPSVRTALGSLGVAIGAGTATRHLYRFEREPLPAPAAPPSARMPQPEHMASPTPPLRRVLSDN